MIRALFLIILSAIGFTAFAQRPTYYQGVGLQMKQMWADSVARIPSDTTVNKTGVARIGSVLYAGNGTYWIAQSSGGSPGTVTSVSAGNLSPLFMTGITNQTTTPDLTFSLSSTSPYTVFGRGAGTGSPSYIANNKVDSVTKNATADSLYSWVNGSVIKIVKDSIGANSFVRDTIDFGSQFVVTSLGANHVDVRIDTIRAGPKTATQYYVDSAVAAGGGGTPTGWDDMLAQDQNQTAAREINLKNNSLSIWHDDDGDAIAIRVASGNIELNSAGNIGFTINTDSIIVSQTHTSSDFTTYLPLATSPDGGMVRMGSWPGGAPAWSLTGNAGTVAGTNFLGTTDDAGLMFKVNDVQAGYIDNATDLFNVSFGDGTMISNTTGERNSAFGSISLTNNTTGSYNSAFGRESLPSNTEGNLNTAIGYGSLTNNISGATNTSVGANSLSTATGDNNTALGSAAGNDIVTGIANTLIGTESDVATSSTDSSIALGFKAVASTKQFAISPYITQIKATGLTTSAGRVLTDVAGNGVLTLVAPSTTSVLTGNLTYVDDVNGNDGTAVLGDFTKPYLTPIAAFTAATSGYTIVVRPGVYTLGVTETQMLKNNVNWYFMPGSIFVANAGTGNAIFEDATGLSCKVTGYGQFYDTLGGSGRVLSVGNSASNIYFECQSITVGNGDADVGIEISNGVVTANIHGTVESMDYDAVIITGGELNLTADKLLSSATDEGNALEIAGGTANVKAREFRSTGIYDASTATTSAIAFTSGTGIVDGTIISELSDGVGFAGTVAGTLTLRGRVTSTTHTAVIYAALTTNKTLINQATLVSNTSFDSIDAPSAQTVVSYGSFANKAVDANITINGILTVGSYVQ